MPRPTPRIRAIRFAVLFFALPVAAAAAEPPDEQPVAHHERPDGPFVYVDRATQPRSPGRRITRGAFTSVQVNVDGLGANIVGDAANEPSIAVDPTDPSRMVIGWRQFDTVTDSFRQAGWAFTADGGASWTFPGSIDAGVFRSDPVVEVDASGRFYYYSLSLPGGSFRNQMFLSDDGGATWSAPLDACGGDKAWLTIDRTIGPGAGHVYAFWTLSFSCSAAGHFNRSIDGAMTFDAPIDLPGLLQFGTLAVAADGTLWVGGTGSGGIAVARSSNASNAGETVAFDFATGVDLGGSLELGAGPNPSGLLGQVWIAADGATGNLYLLASIDPPGDPLDVHFSRSTDGGATWSAPLRINDDPVGNNAWQWFGTMSVAPNGRIDVVWYDTRNAGGGLDSELFYSLSTDGGASFSPSLALSPAFDPLVGHPQQSKLGDYIHMVSTDDAAHLAYAATFNGEQDVYYLRIDPLAAAPAVFADGFESGDTSAWSVTVP